MAKDQYKLFKDQINVINNNRKDEVKPGDSVKVEDGEIYNEKYRYVSDKYKDLINNIF